MKKIILFFLVFLFSFNSYAQMEIIKEYTGLNEDILEKEYQTIDGIKNGLYREYYLPDSQLNKKGNLQYEVSFKDGKEEGKYTEYFDIYGKIKKEEGFFKNGVKEGACTNFSKDGALIKEYAYKNGKIEGTYRKYYKNGKIRADFNYKNGEKEGPYKIFYKNGTLKLTGTYKNDKAEGVANFFNKNGKLVVEANYVKDKLEGNQKFYHKNGKLFSEGLYKKGEAEGVHKNYYDNGKLCGTEVYKNNKLVSGTNPDGSSYTNAEIHNFNNEVGFSSMFQSMEECGYSFTDIHYSLVDLTAMLDPVGSQVIFSYLEALAFVSNDEIREVKALLNKPEMKEEFLKEMEKEGLPEKFALKLYEDLIEWMVE